MEEGVDPVTGAFERHADTGVPEIAHAAPQSEIDCSAVDERSESDALDDAVYLYVSAFHRRNQGTRRYK
ncbi:hypothetical protein GCM10027355_10990 [Haloplanus salinarum]